MSLDLYLMSKNPITKRGTGVYVRENGQNRELETIAEVRKYFPDADLSGIEEMEYITNELWHGNITHNMGKMAGHIPAKGHTLYEFLWRPEEIECLQVSEDYVLAITEGLAYMKKHREELLQYNPPVDPTTGRSWGTYELLASFCVLLLNSLNAMDYESNECQIHASR